MSAKQSQDYSSCITPGLVESTLLSSYDSSLAFKSLSTKHLHPDKCIKSGRVFHLWGQNQRQGNNDRTEASVRITRRVVGNRPPLEENRSLALPRPRGREGGPAAEKMQQRALAWGGVGGWRQVWLVVELVLQLAVPRKQLSFPQKITRIERLRERLTEPFWNVQVIRMYLHNQSVCHGMVWYGMVWNGMVGDEPEKPSSHSLLAPRQHAWMGPCTKQQR